MIIHRVRYLKYEVITIIKLIVVKLKYLVLLIAIYET